MHQLRYYNFKKEILRFQNSRIIRILPEFIKKFRKIAKNFHFHDDMIHYSQNEIIKE